MELLLDLRNDLVPRRNAAKVKGNWIHTQIILCFHLVDVDVRRIKLDAVIIVVLDILTPDGL
jgi:hypothetical protein